MVQNHVKDAVQIIQFHKTIELVYFLKIEREQKLIKCSKIYHSFSI